MNIWALCAAVCFAFAVACFEGAIEAHWMFWLLLGLMFWALATSWPLTVGTIRSNVQSRRQ
jgi:drug/metabolite transporter (DMT)-like permease